MHSRFPLLLISIILVFACGEPEKSTSAATTGTDSLPDIPVKDEVYGIARIEPEKEIVTVSAGASGKVLKVMIRGNDYITAGQELIRLDNTVELAELKQVESQLITQEAGESLAQENLQKSEMELEKAKRDLILARDLLEGKAETRQNVIDLEAKVDQLTQQLKIQKASLEQTLAQRKTIEAQIQYYRTMLAKKKITAPTAGKVLQVLVHPGEYLTSSTGVMDYAPEGDVIAKTEIDELFADKVKPGQKASIYSQMTGEEIARGKVIYAADYLSQKSLFKNQSTELEDRRVREVKVKLEEGTFPLYGSRVDCRIYTK